MQESTLYGFIDETGFGKAPAAGASESVQDKYERQKVKSRAILINSISPEFRHAAAQYETIKKVWEHLKSVFAPSTRPRKMRLLQELCLIEKKLDETMLSFVDRLDTAAKDYASLKLTDEDMKTYLLITRCGKESDQLRLIIDQWSDDDFKWEKVSNALLAEKNHHRYSELKVQSSKSKNSKYQRPKGRKPDTSATPNTQSTQQQQSSERKPFVLTCYNCQGAGHIARDCPSPTKKQKPVKNVESASVSTSASGARPKSVTKDRIYLANPVIDDNCFEIMFSESVSGNLALTTSAPFELGEGYSSIQGIGDIRLYVKDPRQKVKSTSFTVLFAILQVISLFWYIKAEDDISHAPILRQVDEIVKP
uniref:CCHC-type domain-containing protein n=1 Tax=Strigamia maritima TaxID=126957 RepID=T1IH83_STRMM